jgi:hypothetical protein
MKIRFVAVLALVTCLLAGSLYSVPGNGTEVTQFLTRIDRAAGSTVVGTISTDFTANTYDDLKGVAQGDVTITSIDYAAGTFSFISCSGPAYASVSVDANNGDSSVNATLDPASPSCPNKFNVFAPVTISVTGQFNGMDQDSQTGTDKSTSNGTSFKSNIKMDAFSETFTGTVGVASGPFSGNASTTRRNDRTRVN